MTFTEEELNRVAEASLRKGADDERERIVARLRFDGYRYAGPLTDLEDARAIADAIESEPRT
jgi:hypothetical protein